MARNVDVVWSDFLLRPLNRNADDAAILNCAAHGGCHKTVIYDGRPHALSILCSVHPSVGELAYFQLIVLGAFSKMRDSVHHRNLDCFNRIMRSALLAMALKLSPAPEFKTDAPFSNLFCCFHGNCFNRSAFSARPVVFSKTKISRRNCGGQQASCGEIRKLPAASTSAETDIPKAPSLRTRLCQRQSATALTAIAANVNWSASGSFEF
mgnify:CR=1 FL=1